MHRSVILREIQEAEGTFYSELLGPYRNYLYDSDDGLVFDDRQGRAVRGLIPSKWVKQGIAFETIKI